MPTEHTMKCSAADKTKELLPCTASAEYVCISAGGEEEPFLSCHVHMRRDQGESHRVYYDLKKWCPRTLEAHSVQ